MFKEYIQYIAKLVKQYDGKVEIASFDIFGNSRFESVLEAKNLTASISILSDLTYEFCLQEIQTKRILKSHTHLFSNKEDLFDKMEEDVAVLSALS